MYSKEKARFITTHAVKTSGSYGWCILASVVNSYVTPSGSTVEASTAADHVYQNQYGDTIGVSGNAVDTDIASKLNWTELEKK